MDKERLILRNIARTNRIFKTYVRSKCDKLGINSSFEGIIVTLSRKGSMSQLELSKELSLSAPTISLTLQKMEFMGYITRSNDSSDARKVQVSLTDKGIDVDEKIKAVFKKIEMKMKELFDEKEEQAFLDTLTLINNTIINMEEDDD